MINVNEVNDNTKSDVLSQKIHADQNEHLHIYGFEKSLLKTIIIYVLYILSIGWVRLLFHWYPRLHLYATHRKCTLNRATKILAIDDYQGEYKSYFVRDVQKISTKDLSLQSLAATIINQDLVEKIKDKKLKINLENGTRCEVYEYKAFWCKKKCYIWDVTKQAFSRLVGLDNGTLCSDFHLSCSNGLSKEEQLLRRIVYGNNDIVVQLQSIGVLLLLEVLNPFYIFQVFTVALWLAEDYLYYTIAIILMSLFGITSTIIQTRRNQLNLRGTVASSVNVHVRVLRNTGIFENISSKELVPGDVIELPKHQATLVCDAVLLTGQCILNESMLTGESVPVRKTALPSRHVLYNANEFTHHTLYSGTTIIQTKYHGDRPVLAKVIRTGYLTNRGGLIAAILYPPPADFKFDKDSYKFIGILAFIATLAVIYTVVTKLSRGITASDVTMKALDIITIVIPPALPAAMTVGKLYAQARLKHAQIYCINNKVINVSGSINCVCFDKTGTLTEDGLDMWGVVPCTNGVLGEAETDISKLRDHPLFKGMLVCHSLTLINGKLCGDPLDVKMFESTKWILKESDCMDVNKYDAVAPVSKLSREAIEQDLEFLGLVILENRLKQPTASVITELREANIRVVMITGDNIQTAISVAKECGILSIEEHVVDVVATSRKGEKDRPKIFFNVQSITQSSRRNSRDQAFATSTTIQDVERGIANCNYRFALTGQTWQALREHYPDLLDRICVRGTIFARMSSDQKQQLIMELMRLGYYVVMCGDGANDCGALRTAHVGISLSEAESSVASPFTSKVSDISCVPKVIREGRAALITSFGIFKFMIAYSLTEFLSVIILYSIDSNLTDLQFLFIDICLIVNFAFFFGKTHAYKKKLSKTTPMSSLIGFTPLLSLTIHMFVMIVFQVIAYYAVQQFSWFTPFVPTSNTRYTCYENYSVYCVSIFQYITMAIIFSRGKPYRRPIYTNSAFMFSIFLLTLICAYITVYPAPWIANALQLILPPVYDWRLIILALAIANFLICFFVESIIIERIIEKAFKRRMYKPDRSKKRYLKIEYELRNCENWPKFGKQHPILSTLRKEDVRNVVRHNNHCPTNNITSNRMMNDFNNSSQLSSCRTVSKGFENLGFVNDQVSYT
ncbi:polyamine-transporting ATPase 13A3 isoform X3 [Anoplolepis gracilipes]|uniref:polyamine-transporting ATPase 13A3 isoform X3 n=1 Tax=Anoplolepis gracilipes TaxID=354296 RepID=UPI003BA05D78